MTKKCAKCKQEFEVSEQEKVYCSLKCRKHRARTQKLWAQAHKENLIKASEKYNKTEKRKLYLIKYREEHRERLREINRKFKKTHRKQITEYKNHRNRTDVNYRLLHNLRIRVYNALKFNFKSKSTLRLIGCSLEQLKSYLEKQFKVGMNWNNYGAWHVDHIRPCASFDLSKKSEQLKCFNYTNLQPLWALENKIKSDT